MSRLKIFGLILIVFGALIALKLKLIFLAAGVAVAAIFIHYVFTKIDTYIKDPQTKAGLNELKKWFSDKFKKKQ
jgi:hypothetical protein